MSLDITFKEVMPVICPHCGEVVTTRTVDEEESSGRGWYEFLESIGYYTPPDKPQPEHDWYGKDMTLTGEQTDAAYQFARTHPLYNGDEVAILIAEARMAGHDVAVNADW